MRASAVGPWALGPGSVGRHPFHVPLHTLRRQPSSWGKPAGGRRLHGGGTGKGAFPCFPRPPGPGLHGPSYQPAPQDTHPSRPRPGAGLPGRLAQTDGAPPDELPRGLSAGSTWSPSP